MTESELDSIIRLIPQASYRQTLVISGQIEVHKSLIIKGYVRRNINKSPKGPKGPLKAQADILSK